MQFPVAGASAVHVILLWGDFKVWRSLDACGDVAQPAEAVAKHVSSARFVFRLDGIGLGRKGRRCTRNRFACIEFVSGDSARSRTWLWSWPQPVFDPHESGSIPVQVHEEAR